METVTEAYQQKRLRLAKIARREAELRLAGDENKAGAQIEKYLCLFREILNRRLNTTKYSDLNVGYDWCCAFVYYCCLEAGFTFSPRPSEALNGSLAAVSIWYDWAIMPENNFVLTHGEQPAIGDLVIFNRLTCDVNFDHIGVVLEVAPDGLVTAEGNVSNVSGIFRRGMQENINCYIRISKY